ncbi:hypothetical protein [Candidatus Palauibacter polyketidifaciens]|uniref:hypothetical protein n=1 Tax=Candidatus Palauibacter polyketidifaciens TaxID=3056740 RepID=UPI00238F59E7|nr:hypothetical protein [Candidatus Palauibacter polyketidifaciens]MDE2719179.1 hypothetical protein [Candidatus Palauibacter polyketidifaciens]
MTRRHRIGALAIAVSVAAGCEAIGAGRVTGQQVCDRPWELEETLRLGSPDGEDALTYVRDLATRPDGSIYLLQSWDPIRVFRSDGRPAGMIGRQGEGPGEWALPLRHAGWLGDTLWVSHRLGTQFLSADGEEIRRVSFRIRLPAEGSHLSPGRPLPDGTFLPSRSVNEDAGLFLKAGRAALRRVSASGEIVDTLAMVERHLGPYALEHETDRYGWGVMTSHPLGPWSGESWLPVAATPDGAAVVLIGKVREEGEDASFDLLQIRFDGDTLLHRTVPYKLRPITRAEASLQRERMADQLARGGSPWDTSNPERKRRIGRELITFPEHYPPVRRIVAGGDGSMWLLREAWPDPADIWEIYGEDGELEGSVRIEGPADHDDWDPRLRILRASRTEVWATTLGEFGVPYVHRYRVDRNCR